MSQNTLFTRLAAIAQRQDEDIERYFAYKMTTEPLSLFKDGLMRKPDKPALRKIVMPESQTFNKEKFMKSAVFTIDGGALLHRVRWSKGDSFKEIASSYMKYVRRHYGTCFIVFDGYQSNSTKSCENTRRTGSYPKCPDVTVEDENKVPYTQERFL